jgi:hypothetical protein
MARARKMLGESLDAFIRGAMALGRGCAGRRRSRLAARFCFPRCSPTMADPKTITPSLELLLVGQIWKESPTSRPISARMPFIWRRASRRTTTKKTPNEANAASAQ